MTSRAFTEFDLSYDHILQSVWREKVNVILTRLMFRCHIIMEKQKSVKLSKLLSKFMTREKFLHKQSFYVWSKVSVNIVTKQKWISTSLHVPLPIHSNYTLNPAILPPPCKSLTQNQSSALLGSWQLWRGRLKQHARRFLSRPVWSLLWLFLLFYLFCLFIFFIFFFCNKEYHMRQIVQFRIRHDRWIKALTTCLYRVSLDLKKIFINTGCNLKIKRYTEL